LNKKTVADVDVKSKRVLVRVDFNVPQDSLGNITDDTRIKASLPTINYLIQQRAKIIICSHLGRPKGREPGLSLAPIAHRLSKLIGRPVLMASDCIGPEVQEMAKNLKEGEILFLENLRFHPEEEKNDAAFARSLASLAEVYVNDAFGTTHRAHASTVGIPHYLQAVAGFLLQKEIDALGGALSNPKRPLAAIIGGAKVSDKMAVLNNILEKVDLLFIGGGMASSFFRAQGYQVGKSKVEEDKLEVCRSILKRAEQRGIRLLLPEDILVGFSLDNGKGARVVKVSEVPPDMMIVDIGPKTLERFAQELSKAKTVIWNGPLGVFEVEEFSHGTKGLVKVLAGLKAFTIIGGGSTAEVVEEMGMVGSMSHVSTGGGASLEFLEGKTLPGVAALQNKEG
jgi:phosphoglycerate kinase